MYCLLVQSRDRISEHLKIVEVKCNAMDERILEVLKFLRGFNIRKLTNDICDALFILKLPFMCVKESKRE